jgi:uncharacterized protein with HEPN domain
MLDAAKKILEYTEGFSFEDFLNDDKTIDAVVRNFEVIGEASARIDPAFQDTHSMVAWKQLTGYRNRLIHEYFGVDYQIVWDIISDELSTLILELNKIADSNRK